MAANRTELASRIAAAQAGDSVRGLFFNVLLQVAEERGGAAARNRIRSPERLGGYSDLRTYPVAEFLNLLFDVADIPRRPSGAAGPQEGGAEQVFHACGVACVRRFAKGPGQIVFGILGKADPHRLFAQVGMAFSTVVSYGQRSYARETERSGIISFARDMQPPAYHQGIFEEALHSMGFEGKVEPRVLGIDRVDYFVSWK